MFLELLRSETAGDPARMERVLAGLRRYQEAERGAAPVPMPAVAEVLGAKLRDYGGTASHASPPVVFVPSQLNPPSVLDLGPGKSLLRWLAGEGFRPLLVDWGWDVETRRECSIGGHVEAVLLPLLDSLGEPPRLAGYPTLVGYCLGGTMALAAAALRPVRGVALIAAPWRFSGFPDEARQRLARLWQAARPAAERLGLLPMEALQSAFWALDPGRTIAKFETFAALDPESAGAHSFVALEDWANDGPPLAGAAARELFETMFAADLPGRGEWRVGGAPVRAEALSCPILDVVSLSDRIVPAACATGIGERIETRAGHVGMMVGSRAEETLWRPLAHWLSRNAPGC